MNNEVSYGKLVLYNFLLGVIGFVVGLIVNLGFIITLIRKIREQLVMSSFEYSLPYIIWDVIGYGVLISFIMLIVSKFFTSGISYIPYLYKTNQLDLLTIIKFGIKKFFSVLITYFVVFMGIIIVVGILSFIPVINFFVYFIGPYLFGLAIFFIDYHLSKNALYGLGATANIDKNFVQLFKHTNSERGVFILPIFYMLVNVAGLANLFIKPLIHQRIITILDDEEKGFKTPPPATPNYYQPPQPPQF